MLAVLNLTEKDGNPDKRRRQTTQRRSWSSCRKRGARVRADGPGGVTHHRASESLSVKSVSQAVELFFILHHIFAPFDYRHYIALTFMPS